MSFPPLYLDDHLLDKVSNLTNNIAVSTLEY